MLGNVAVRAGKKLDWDGPNMKITNDEPANQLLHPASTARAGACRRKMTLISRPLLPTIRWEA